MSTPKTPGGYILINCGGADLATSTGQTCPGLYNMCSVAHTYRKPVYASNLKFEGDPVTPVAVLLTKRESGNFIGTAATLQIEVAPDNSITVHNMITPSATNRKKG